MMLIFARRQERVDSVITKFLSKTFYRCMIILQMELLIARFAILAFLNEV